MLALSEGLMRELETHVREGYPAEVCGFLLGVDGKVRRVETVRPGKNLRGKTTRDRYLVDPRDTLRADQEARQRGLEMLGFYHSHPEHPPVPSTYDVEHAWPWYTYLIVSISSQGIGGARAWRLEGEEMVEDPITIMEANGKGE